LFKNVIFKIIRITWKISEHMCCNHLHYFYKGKLNINQKVGNP